MILDRIKELCKATGISINALEMHLKFGRGTILAWGKVSPSVNKLEAVADYFGVSLDFLVKGEEHGTADN